jgi:hypothetical protein
MAASRVTGQLANTNTNVANQYVETDENYEMDVSDGIVSAIAPVDVLLPPDPFIGETHQLFANGGIVTLKGNGNELYDQGNLGDVLIDNHSGLIVTFVGLDSTKKWITTCCQGRRG